MFYDENEALSKREEDNGKVKRPSGHKPTGELVARVETDAPTEPGWYYASSQHIKGRRNVGGIHPVCVFWRGGPPGTKQVLMILDYGTESTNFAYYLWFGPVVTCVEMLG